jgi:hypothetical protein
MANDRFFQEKGITFEALRSIHKRARQPKNAREILRAHAELLEGLLDAGGRSRLSTQEVAEIEEYISRRK